MIALIYLIGLFMDFSNYKQLNNEEIRRRIEIKSASLQNKTG